MPMLKRAAIVATSPPLQPVACQGADAAGLLQTSKLSLVVNGQRLVDAIDLVLDPAQLTVVMGPNGAGKSLLLRLVHGLIAPTEGHISWGGKPLSPDVRATQAMVFQRPVLLRRSVTANMAFALSLKATVDPRRIEALLARVGLEDKAQQPARRLSGGEQQRLALARALALEPKVLLLDEPTANLDPASALLIEEIVAEEHRAGCKVIFVTHNPPQARRLAGDVVFMHRGRVVTHTSAPAFFAGETPSEAQAFLEGRHVP